MLERMNALGESMGMTVEWWDEELPLSDVGGVDLEEPAVALEECRRPGYRAGVKQITFKSPLSQIGHCLSIRTVAVWERLQE